MPIRLTGNQLDGLAIVRAQITASTTTTATSSGTSTVMMTVGPAFYEGGTYLFWLDAPFITKGTTNINLELWVDGVFQQSLTGVQTVSTVVPGQTITALVPLVLGSHTLTVRGFVDAGTGTLGAGTGATGQNPPCLAFVTAI